jgi:type I restriction enzyme M protein
LLAGHALFVEKGLRKPYLIGEDLDAMCCKMSAVNLMSHGCYGEVVCHNTLTEPGEVRMGFVVNEGMYPFVGIPTIRRENKPELLVTTAVWRRKKEQAERIKEEEPQPKKQEAVQLSLF